MIVVVLETGAVWPEWIPGMDEADRPATLTIAQRDDESLSELAARALQRIEALRASRRGLTQAVIACGERGDEGAFGARAELCDAVLGTLSRSGRTNLFLSANDRCSGATRHALSRFVQDLSARWAGAPAGVALRIGCANPSFVRRVA